MSDYRRLRARAILASFGFCVAFAGAPSAGANPQSAPDRLSAFRKALSATRTASKESTAILARIEASADRFIATLQALSPEFTADPLRFALVDKTRALVSTWAPSDLVPLDTSGLPVSKSGMLLRRGTVDALSRMVRAARDAGITLLTSSAYRSYEYQRGLFARNVAELGELEASRVSAKPGQSQHQLGTVMDFGSIDDSFAATPAGRWLESNASRFGFSLSFPKGLEPVTGYVWESWHYRWLGTTALILQKDYFGDVQQYLIEFLDALTASGRLPLVPAKNP